MSQNVYTPTQARQNFFKILKQVEKGNEIIIQPKHSSNHFILTKKETPEQPTMEEVEKILDELGNIGLNMNGVTPEDIDRIIDEDFTRELPE